MKTTHDICREVRNATLLALLGTAALVVLGHVLHGAEPTPSTRQGAVGVGAVGLPRSWRTPDAERSQLAMEFDPLTGNARWCMARITPAMLAGGAQRSDKFYPEPSIPEVWRATNADWKDSGFDRGHGIAARFFSGDQAAQDRTFSLLNMNLQVPENNRGFWGQKIEAAAVALGASGTVDLYVNFVAIYRHPGQAMNERRVGPHQLAVPKELCLAVLVTQADRPDRPLRMPAWRVPNRAVPREHSERQYRVTPDEVELAAGLDLCPELPDEIETELEASLFRE